MTNLGIELGDQVYASDGSAAFGAVRAVHPHALVVFIEGTGDVEIPAGAVGGAHDGKVLVLVANLPHAVRAAVTAAHAREDPGA